MSDMDVKRKAADDGALVPVKKAKTDVALIGLKGRELMETVSERRRRAIICDRILAGVCLIVNPGPSPMAIAIDHHRNHQASYDILCTALRHLYRIWTDLVCSPAVYCL